MTAGNDPTGTGTAYRSRSCAVGKQYSSADSLKVNISSCRSDIEDDLLVDHAVYVRIIEAYSILCSQG